MKTHIFGDFIEHFPPEQDSLEITFSPCSSPIRKRWRNHRLSAYFVADYFTNFLPRDEDVLDNSKRLKESKGAVSYVANELLENAIKFNDETSHYKVKFGIHFVEGSNITAAVFATNSIRPVQLEPFQAYIQDLLANDPKDLYIRQLEKNAESESETSGLGLLTMINDYDARVGWRFETINKGLEGDRPPALITIVTTMVQIKV